jgi:hypothetical protein
MKTGKLAEETQQYASKEDVTKPLLKRLMANQQACGNVTTYALEKYIGI